jgi:hypothetical protein
MFSFIIAIGGLGSGFYFYGQDVLKIEASNGPSGTCRLIGHMIPYDCWAQRPAPPVPCETVPNITQELIFMIDYSNRMINCTFNDSLSFYDQNKVAVVNGSSFDCWSTNFDTCRLITAAQQFSPGAYSITMIVLGAVGLLILFICSIISYSLTNKAKSKIGDSLVEKI